MTNNPIEPTDESIEDILSSIRETVEEESTKDGDDLDPEALAEQMLAEQADDEEDETPAPDTNSPDDDIDESLMSATGIEASSSKDDFAMNDDDVDVDALLAEAAEEAEDGSESEATEAVSSAEEDDVLDLVDEVESDSTSSDDDFVDVEHFEETGETKAAKKSEVSDAQKSYDEPAEEEDVDAALSDMGVEEITDEAVLAAFKGAAGGSAGGQADYVHLNALPGANGLQVGFPMEVLAEALRPLVKGWIQNNLPDIVERLVKEELEKLAEK